MECKYCEKTFEEGDDYFEFENEIYCEECFDEEVKECFRKEFYEEDYDE